MGKLKFYLGILLLCFVFLAAGCGNSGSADTVWISMPGTTLSETTLSGTVTDAQGNAFFGVEVTLYSGDTVIQTAVADEDGNYSFFNLALGEYTLTVEIPGYVPYSQTVTITSSGAVVENIVILSYVSLSGTLTTAVLEGEIPVADAAISLLQNDIVVASTTSNEDGTYSIGGIVPGDYTVHIEANACSDYNGELTLTVSTVEDIKLESLRYTISGKVLPPAGVPINLANVRVYLRDPSKDIETDPVEEIVLDSVTCSETGAYTFTSVLPGTYELFLSGTYTGIEYSGHFYDLVVELTNVEVDDVTLEGVMPPLPW